MAQERISGPSSMTGILRFYDIATGGPQLDPRAVVAVSIAFIALVKIASLVVR
ncbi:MAG: preprotein translocase subunit Sec61beta [Candidatus Micrarchaeia archaeon]